MRTLRLLLSVLVCAGSSSAVLAQEREPNNLCSVPQPAPTPLAIPAAIDASLADPGVFFGTSDLDYFYVSTTPGQALRVTAGTAVRVGLFDEQCQLIEASSTSGLLDVVVPEGGRLVLAVAERNDFGFRGLGSRTDRPYRLVLRPQPPALGSISGRAVDAVTSGPVSGVQPPDVFVDLQRCNENGCFPMARQLADASGRFRFEVDEERLRLPPGAYRVHIAASSYTPASVDVTAAAGEDIALGDVALRPPPLLFSDLRACPSLGPEGGTCAYSVDIRNNTGSPMTGVAHSVVEIPFEARFEASTGSPGDGSSVHRASLRIPARGRETVTFAFEVPALVNDGAMFCTELLFGRTPSPLVNFAGREELFCMIKGPGGVRTLGPEESRELFESTRD